MYSDTHLLALAFVGELAYWRWSAAKAATADAEAAGGAEAAATDADADASAAQASAAVARQWFRRAVVAVHRYLHTVDVLMEGCMWSTVRSRELLRLLSAEDPAAVNAALEGEVGVEERELAAMRLDEEAGAAAGGARGGGAAARKKGGKKGKRRG